MDLPKACIIGAGCSGFTTAKRLQDLDVPFDCFEASDNIGGNWYFKNPNGLSACYESLHIDTSKWRYRLPGPAGTSMAVDMESLESALAARAGAMGVEIWCKLDGPPPTDEKDCTFLTLDAFTPYLATYPGGDGGKIAHYMLRWRLRDGATLAWGETVSATITA